MSFSFVSFKFVCAAALACPLLLAQRWEFGAGGGASFYTSSEVARGSQSARAGLDRGFAATAVLGQDLHQRLGGEIRYTFQSNALKLSQGGTKATFSARTHAVHYDVLIHFAPPNRALRPFLAAGGGMKLHQGTGEERSVQPLSQFAFLTRTSEWKPLISLGGGIKWKIGRSALLRLEARDYLSPLPRKLIAPAPGATIGGWLHDIVLLAGISAQF